MTHEARGHVPRQERITTMPKFSVMLTQAVTISGELEVTAKDEDAASAKVQEMLDNFEIPALEWEVPSTKQKRIDAIEWEAQEGVTIEIDEINEF
jgi:hypothetical protein